MKIKNLTSDTQKLVVREITGEKKVYDIFVTPYGTTDIERMTIRYPEDLSGIFEVEGNILPKVVESAILSEDSKEDSISDILVSVHDEDMNDDITEESKSESHICEICGAEFGSARGLSSHRNRAHPEN